MVADNLERHDRQQRILAVVRNIRAGRTASYAEVAQRAGLPGRARLVARILAENDDATTPWHRVVRSDGRIAFPPGSAGFSEQQRRLAAEGVALQDGRVQSRAKLRAATLDQLLWGEET